MKLLSALLLLGLSSFHATPAHAIVDAAKTCYIDAAAGTGDCAIGATAGAITSSAWRTMISSATRALKGLHIYNSTPVFLQVAIGPSGSEQLQLTIPPGTLPGNPGAGYPGAPVGSYAAGQGFFYPIPISQGTKVAVKALGSDPVGGYVIVTEFFY